MEKLATLGKNKKSVLQQQRSWPTDRYDTTGGSFPVRPDDNCSACPGKQHNDRNYSRNFLRSHLLSTNPATLCALKKTEVAQNILREPKIQLVSPKFTHDPGRSTSFLRVPSIYKSAVCKINENITNEDRILRAHEYKKLREQAEDVMINKEIKELYGRRGHKLSYHMSSGSEIFQRKKPKPNDNLIDICKQGQLLQHVRRNVATDLKRIAAEEKERQRFKFPSAANLRLEIDRFNSDPDGYPPERYAYDPDAGMTMMCARKQILATFYETKSEESIINPVIPEESKEEMVFKPSKAEFKLGDITASTLEIFKKAPRTTLPGPVVLQEQFPPFSHFGLVAKCKEDAFKRTKGRLARREKDFDVPEEFEKSVYGPIKGLPNHFKISVPPHLAPDMPPSNEELDKVEKAMEHDKELAKIRRKQGKKSVVESTAMLQRFTKSLIESDEDIVPPQQRKRLLIPEDYPQKFNETMAKDSSDTLFCTVAQAVQEDKSAAMGRQGKRPTLPWIASNLSEVRSKVSTLQRDIRKEQKSWKLNAIKSGKLKNHPKMTLSSMELSESLEGDEEEVYNPELRYLDAIDSREELPYSDVPYSDIEVPKNVPGIRRAPLYRVLAQENKSSSDEITPEESSSNSESDFGSDESDNDETDEEEEDEDEEEEETKEKTSKINIAIKVAEASAPVQKKSDEDLDISNFKSIYKTQMDLEHVFKTPSYRWQKLKTVEKVPTQIKLKEGYDLSTKLEKRKFNSNYYWDRVFGAKATKERQRQQRLADNRKILKYFDNSDYKFYQDPQKSVKTRSKSVVFDSNPDLTFFDDLDRVPSSSSFQSFINRRSQVLSQLNYDNQYVDDDDADQDDNDQDDDDALQQLIKITAAEK